jgi:hypothetical protein
MTDTSPPPPLKSVVHGIIRGIFSSTRQASRILGINERQIFRCMAENKLTRRQLRIIVNSGHRRAENLSVQAKPRYSPACRREAEEDRQRCLDAIAKAEALLDAMKTPR